QQRDRDSQPRQQTQQSQQGQQGQQNGAAAAAGAPGTTRDDEFGGGRRRGRFRERNRGRGPRDRFGPGDAEPVVTEDDVLVPIAGIVDILDNYAFVRTGGYLPSPNDVYVSLAQVRRYGLRKG